MKREMFIKKSCEIQISVSPQELAKIFADSNDKYQAEFFNELAKEVGKWKNPFCFQLQGITDNPILTKDAREIMREIGEYSSKLTSIN